MKRKLRPDREPAVNSDGSEISYRELLDHMNDTAWVINFDTSILDVNEAAVRVLGYSREELLSMKIPEIDSSLLPEQIEALAGTMEKDQIQIFETSHCTKDGRFIPMEISSSLVSYGNRTVILSIARNISKRKQAEEKLRAGEETYRGLIESMDSLIALADQDGRLLYLNNVAADRFGLPVEKLTGATIQELLSKNDTKYLLELIHTSLTQDRAELGEYLLSIGGIPRWYKTTIQPIHDRSGKPKHAILNLVDINNLKTAQQELIDLNAALEEKVRERSAQYQDLYDKAPVGYHSLDSAGNFVSVNQTESEWLGYTSEELTGKHVTTIIAPDFYKVFETTFQKLIRKGRIANLEFRVLSKDGTTFPAEVNATAIYDRDGRFCGTRSTLQNISIRKKVEAALNKAVMEAEVANNAKSEFLLNVSHEFRTPLNAVIGCADLLERAEGADRILYAESVKSNGRRLLYMVSDILDLIRLEKGDIELENDVYRPNELFREIVENFTDKVREKGLKFNINISPDLPHFITIDANRLKQVVSNLLNNAVKFTSGGEISLKVSSITNNEINNSADLIIEVRDTGKGMTEEFQNKMFEAFSQAETKRSLSGVGIGLTLCNLIVGKMNGSVKVTSETGMGSCFLVSIPVVVPESSSYTDRDSAVSVPGYENALPGEAEIRDLKKLLSILEGVYLNRVQAFELRQPIGEIKKTGQDLADLGENHNCRVISDYGRELTKSACNFDIDTMLKLIRKYRDVIDKIRN
jgi:PAS domain S-box-containing protein